MRLILEPDGSCTIDIDHFGAEAEDAMPRVEAAIKNLYNGATNKAATPTIETEKD